MKPLKHHGGRSLRDRALRYLHLYPLGIKGIVVATIKMGGSVFANVLEMLRNLRKTVHASQHLSKTQVRAQRIINGDSPPDNNHFN